MFYVVCFVECVVFVEIDCFGKVFSCYDNGSELVCW